MSFKNTSLSNKRPKGAPLWPFSFIFGTCLPDNVSRVHLDGPGAAQIVVVRKRVSRGKNPPKGLALKTSAALRYNRTQTQEQETRYPPTCSSHSTNIFLLMTDKRSGKQTSWLCLFLYVCVCLWCMTTVHGNCLSRQSDAPVTPQ